MGETHLFFGCRNEAIDYIYREELEAFAADGLLTLHTAFSRDQVCRYNSSLVLVRLILEWPRKKLEIVHIRKFVIF